MPHCFGGRVPDGWLAATMSHMAHMRACSAARHLAPHASYAPPCARMCPHLTSRFAPGDRLDPSKRHVSKSKSQCARRTRIAYTQVTAPHLCCTARRRPLSFVSTADPTGFQNVLQQKAPFTLLCAPRPCFLKLFANPCSASQCCCRIFIALLRIIRGTQ